MIKKILFLFIILTSTIVFSQEKSIDQLDASPNPFSDKTIISFESNSNQNVLVFVRNVLGKTIFTKTIEAHKGSNKIPFYRDNLKSGMYIYAIHTNKDFITKRFVIR